MAQKNEKYVITLRNYLFRAPNLGISLLIFLIVIGAFSYLLHPDVYEVTILFILPYLITISADYILIKCLKIYFPMRRIATLNLIAFVISFVEMWLLMFFFSFFFSFYLSFSFLIYLRFMIYRVFLSGRNVAGGIISLNYNIVILIISIFYFNNLLFSPLIPYLISVTIYGFMAFILLRTSTSKFRREFREDPLFFLSSFINYLARYEKIDKEKLDKFFKSIYQKRSVPISTLVFKNGKKIKFSFIFPYIHPGPFGDIGGSNIPNKLEGELNMENFFVFHTTSTHDDNIATEDDVKKIGEVIKEEFNCDCKYENFSDFYRLKINNVDAGVQIFGKYPVIFLIPTNAMFDDVELRTGLLIRRKLNTIYEDSAVIDAHNRFDENAVPLSLTTTDSSTLRRFVKNIKVDKKIKAGFAVKRIKGKGIGPGGIRAAVFNYGRKRIAYILIDGNNIKKGLRDEIRNNLKDLADEIEVFSTDNHIVNMSLVDLNPVGEKDDWKMIVNACREVVKDAIGNIEDVCVCMKTKNIEMNMASHGELEKLTDITRESVGTAKIFAPLTFFLGFLLSFLTFILF